MPKSQLNGPQVKDGGITRADLNTGTVGSAVITQLIQGAGLSISGTGADAGTGDVTVGIATGGVTLAMMADMAQASLLGRVTASTGAPEVLSAGQARGVLGLATTDQVRFSQIQLVHATSAWLNFMTAAGGSGFIIGRSYANTNLNDLFFYDQPNSAARLYISSAGGVTVGGTTNAGVNNLLVTGSVQSRNFIGQTTATTDMSIVLRGTALDASVDNSNGIMLALTHNGTGNRQIIFGDSAGVGSSTKFSFRFIVGANFDIPNIDGINNDGSVAKSINLGGPTSGVNVGIGFTPGTSVQADILAKLHIQTTAIDQIRFGRDATNYAKASVSSAGMTTWTAGGSAPGFTFAQALICGERLRLKASSVSGLPGTPVQGDKAIVSDALSPTPGTAVVGGGAVVTEVVYNGTIWIPTTAGSSGSSFAGSDAETLARLNLAILQ